MRIGLFGGTFDPPHEAHVAASLLALKRLKLDRVWWLVTPGNPLKDTRGLGPLKARIAAARALTHHPRIDVTGLEAVINTRYTYDTIKWLVARCPGVHFVWIMGADNLRSFHRWQKWRGITKLVPFAVIDRLGPSLYAAASPAGQALNHARIAEVDATSLPFRKPPAWVFIHGLKSPLSSTALRALRRLGGTAAEAERSSTSGKGKKSKPAGKKSVKKRKLAGKPKRPAKNKRKSAKKGAKKSAKKSTKKTGRNRRKSGKKRT
jgi:nicotinate-nucleotide adenylyltransferase